MDNAFEHLEAVRDAVFLEDRRKRRAVVLQGVVLGGGDVAGRHVARKVVQEEVGVGARLKLRRILGVELLVPLPLRFGQAVPGTAQKALGGRILQAVPAVEQQEAFDVVGASQLLAQVHGGGQAQVSAAGVAGEGQAVAVDAVRLALLVQVLGDAGDLLNRHGELRLG